MTRALEADDLDAWAAADERFHQGLVELAGNRTLIDAVARLGDRVHRARMFTLRLRPKPVNSTHEHMAMLERIRAGDAARRGRSRTARTASARRRELARDLRAVPTAADCSQGTRVTTTKPPTTSACCPATASASK